MASARRSLSTGGENPEFVLREFQGMNNNAAREAINDEEFYWLENVIPLAGGNLQPVPQSGATLASIAEGVPPTYCCPFTVAGVNYVFAVFGLRGNGYIINLATNAVITVFTGTLSTSSTFATPYNNQGILIIDPSGYFDWGVTTANTLTSQNNSITGATVAQSTSFAGNATVTNSGISPGTGGNIVLFYQAISVTINAGGTGYVVGDALTLTDGVPYTASTATSIIVSSVSSGVITGITFSTQGQYVGPGPGGSLAVGPSGTAVSGGSGTGATFTVKMRAIGTSFINSPGTGYVNNTVTQDKVGATTVTSWTIQTSGIIGGTCIATYAGRVWLSSGRTVYVTNIGSYNNFGGAGTSFTITDAYVTGSISCLYAANNYLYIFSPSSIDALSNVTVSSGVTSFSRINVTTSVGTSQPQSVFGYYRAIGFYHASGFYLLAGATPEKISDRISGVLRAANNNLTVVCAGCTVLVAGELCAAWQLSFTDTFSPVGGNRMMVFCYFKGKWWSASFANMANNYAGSIFSVVGGSGATALQGIQVMYYWALPGLSIGLHQAFSSVSLSSWIARTKLWDAGSALREKQSLNAAIAGNLLGNSSSGVTATVDTELNSSATVSFPLISAVTGYNLMVHQANNGGGQYLGLTFNGDGTDVSQVRLMALRGKTERDFMQ